MLIDCTNRQLRLSICLLLGTRMTSVQRNLYSIGCLTLRIVINVVALVRMTRKLCYRKDDRAMRAI